MRKNCEKINNNKPKKSHNSCLPKAELIKEILVLVLFNNNKLSKHSKTIGNTIL